MSLNDFEVIKRLGKFFSFDVCVQETAPTRKFSRCADLQTTRSTP